MNINHSLKIVTLVTVLPSPPELGEVSISVASDSLITIKEPKLSFIYRPAN